MEKASTIEYNIILCENRIEYAIKISKLKFYESKNR